MTKRKENRQKKRLRKENRLKSKKKQNLQRNKLLAFLKTRNTKSEQACMSKCTHVIIKTDRGLNKLPIVRVFNTDKEIGVKGRNNIICQYLAQYNGVWMALAVP